MGFTGLLILAQAEVPLTDLQPLVGCNVELVSRRDDGWQLATLTDDVRGPAQMGVLLVDATAAQVLVAQVNDSTHALLMADSPSGRRWQVWLNGTAFAVGDPPDLGDAQGAVAWAAEAGKAAGPEVVLKAMSAADRDTEAFNRAWTDARKDVDALGDVIRNQTSHVEIHVLRVLAALGFAARAVEEDSWWGYLVRKSTSS